MLFGKSFRKRGLSQFFEGLLLREEAPGRSTGMDLALRFLLNPERVQERAKAE